MSRVPPHDSDDVLGWDGVRAESDPERAAEVAERAGATVRTLLWLVALFATLAPAATVAATWVLDGRPNVVAASVVAVVVLVLAAPFVAQLGFDAAATRRANLAVLAGEQPPAEPSRWQRIGWFLLALLIARSILAIPTFGLAMLLREDGQVLDDIAWPLWFEPVMVGLVVVMAAGIERHVFLERWLEARHGGGPDDGAA